MGFRQKKDVQTRAGIGKNTGCHSLCATALQLTYWKRRLTPGAAGTPQPCRHEDHLVLHPYHGSRYPAAAKPSQPPARRLRLPLFPAIFYRNE